MKKIKSLMVLVLAFALVSCNSNSGLAGSDAAAKTAGKACGKVLSDLYAQYKSSGTIDAKSPATTKGVAELGTYYTLLKDNKSNANYKKAFAGGLISGSAGLVTKKNSTSVLNSLLSMSGVSESPAKVNTIVSVLKNLFATLGK